MYFQGCNMIDITINSQEFESVIQVALIEPHDSAICIEEISFVCESNNLMSNLTCMQCQMYSIIINVTLWSICAFLRQYLFTIQFITLQH